MKRTTLAAALLLAPSLAMAQPATSADPSAQALGQMVLEAAQREAALRTQLIAAQARIATLEAKTAEPQAPKAPSP